MPYPGSRNVRPLEVAGGTFIETLPRRVGTSIEVPSAASGAVIGRVRRTSSPLRSKNGCAATVTLRYRSPRAPGAPVPSPEPRTRWPRGSRLRPAAAARGARLSLDVAGALTDRARLLEVHRERLARPVKGLVERDLDARLHIGGAGAPVEAFVEPDPSGAGAAAGVRGQVSEDRAEDLGEVPEVSRVFSVLHSEAASGRGSRRGLGVALPVGS